MDGVIIVFHLPQGSSSAQHREFRRQIYGEDTTSWGGRYKYRRRGILDGIPHVRLYWGAVIVRKEDAGRFIEAVKENGGTAYQRKIALLKEDKKVLATSIR